MNKMSDLEIGWVLGMLEGEATVGAWACNQNRPRKDGTFSTLKYARVELSSVDFECLEKLQSLTGVGVIHKHYDENNRPKHKKSATWRISKAEEVIEILRLWLEGPFLSEHRRTQIGDALEAAEAVVSRRK